MKATKNKFKKKKMFFWRGEKGVWDWKTKKGGKRGGRKGEGRGGRWS